MSLEQQKLDSIESMKRTYRTSSPNDKVIVHIAHILALDIKDAIIEAGGQEVTHVQRQKGKPPVRQRYYSIKSSALMDVLDGLVDFEEIKEETAIIEEELPSYLTEENEAE